MKRLLLPAILLMVRLKFPQKMVVIGSLVFLPLITFLYLLISEVNIAVDFAEKERQGVQYGQSVIGLLHDIQQHRGMTSAFLSGDTLFKERIDKTELSIQQIIRTIDMADKEWGAILKTTKRWNTIKQRWLDLKGKLYTLSPEESFRYHTDLVSDIRDFLIDIADSSNLTLDPNIDSYYLMDTIVTELPLTTEYIGQVRGLGSGMAARGQLTFQEGTHMTILFGLIKTTLISVENNMSKVFEENAGLKPLLSVQLQNTIDMVNSLLETINNKMIKAKKIKMSAKDYFDECTKTIDSGVKLHRLMVPALDTVLEARIDVLNKKKYFIGIFSIFSLTTVVYLFIGNYFSIMKAINILVESSKGVAKGDLTTRANVETKDELSLIATSFNEMVTALDKNIAMREKAENEIVESRNRYEALIDAAIDAIISIDSNGIIVGWNKGAEKMMNINKEEALGTSVTNLMPERYRSLHEQGLKRQLASDEEEYIGRMTELYALRNGKEFPIELSVSKWRTGKDIFFTGIIRDITKRREIDELKEDIVMITRHDLKNPLTPIIGYAKMLMTSNNLTERQAEFIKSIHKSSHRMLDMINRSMDLYKMEKGIYQYKPAAIDLISIIKHVIDDLSSVIAEKEINVQTSFDRRSIVHDDTLTVAGEGLLCYSMLENLIKNAVEASPKGEKVSVNIEKDREWADIDIHNKGVIPEAIRDTFMKKYVKSGKKTGTGLGVYSAKIMAQTQKGAISWQSSSEDGTHVIVRLQMWDKSAH